MTDSHSPLLAMSQLPQRLCFDGFLLDTVSWKLTNLRTKPVADVALDSRALQVLAYLVAHNERVVSKDELFEQIWTPQVVSDNALTQAVTRARRALGDDSKDAQQILTIRNRGYRFIGRLEPLPALQPAVPVPQAQRRAGWRLWAGAIAAMVAVLLLRQVFQPAPVDSVPLASLSAPSAEQLVDVAIDIQGLSDDPQAQAFAQSLADALHIALPGMFGAAAASTHGDRASSRDQAATDRADIETRSRLTGTILTRGHESLINMELRHPRVAEPLWQIQGHRIPSSYSLHYRERLVDTLAAVTRRPVHPDNRKTLRQSIRNPQTPFELLVTGRQLYLQFNEPANERAIANFERALAIAPDWFPAQSSLALSVAARRHRYRQDSKWLDIGAELARSAVGQSNNAYDAWRALGMVAIEQGQPELALEYFQTALVLAPEHYPTVYTVGLTLYSLGRLDDAIAVYTRIQNLPIGRAMLMGYLVELGLDEEAERLSAEPFSNAREFALANYALLYKAALSGDFEQARELGHSLRSSYPAITPALLRLCAEVEQHAGNIEQAHALFEQAYEADPENTEARIRIAEVWQQQGEAEQAQQMLQQVVAELTQSVAAGVGRWDDMRSLATAHALLGDLELALAWRQRSILAGAYTNPWDQSDSRYERIASDPRFVEQTLTMQAKVTQMRSRALDHLLAANPEAERTQKKDP